MKIKWGMMMTDGRGKLGGQVASKNRSGAYVRTKVTPSNPQTEAQSIVRSIFGILSKNWGMLEESTRMAWNRSADGGLFAKTNVFGDTVRHSGKSLYTSVNSLARIHQGINFTFPPMPADFNEQGSEVYFEGVTDTDSVISALSLETGIVGDLPIGAVLQVQATPPLSAGISNFTSHFRDIASLNNPPTATPILLTSQYRDKFGEIVHAGRKIGVRFRQIVDGQASPWVGTSAIIVLE